jgi:hypothetical protein
LIADTLAMDMIKPTYQLDGIESKELKALEKEAFSLKVVSEERELKNLAKRKKIDKIFVTFKEGATECSYEMCR